MVESFTSRLPHWQLQQKLTQIFYEINLKEFSFEEVSNPTIPSCKVFFEFGLADFEGFNYIDEEEVKKTIELLTKEHLHIMDFFCGIRYYKNNAGKKTALKFDYYMLRTIFSRDRVEIQVHHERGPRYISPEELIMFVFNQTNKGLDKKVLRKSKP